MGEELKPCPFCNEELLASENIAMSDVGKAFWVLCPECKANGPASFYDEDLAVGLWNDRPIKQCGTCQWYGSEFKTCRNKKTPITSGCKPNFGCIHHEDSDS